MKIKALRSFSGKIAMAQDEVRDVRDEIAAGLIKVGYAVAMEERVEPEPESEPTPTPEKKTGAKAAPKK